MHHILIVEDEALIRRLLRTLLEQAGYDVIEAENGKEAIRIARYAAVDLVITDLIMPEKEGIELIQHFRKSLRDVKVIAISGFGYGQYLRMAKSLGADAVFEKPFRPADLLTAVTSLLTTENR